MSVFPIVASVPDSLPGAGYPPKASSTRYPDPGLLGDPVLLQPIRHADGPGPARAKRGGRVALPDALAHLAGFRKGYIEEIPLPDASVDVVISNCVLNLSGDKPKVIREAARVLRPGGRFAISDVIADPDMDAATRADMQQWTGCIAGALTREEFEGALAAAGLTGVEIRETHRVNEHACAAIIRASKPGERRERSRDPAQRPADAPPALGGLKADTRGRVDSNRSR